MKKSPTRTLLFTAFATTLACSLSGALFLACSSKDSDKNAENGGAGGDTGTTGGKQSGDETAVGASCTSTADCENADTEHCTVSCENVAGKKRCVTRSVDADGDGEGTSACTAAPGVDCDDADAEANSSAPVLQMMGDEHCVVSSGSSCSDRKSSFTWLDDKTPLVVYQDSALPRFVGLPLDAKGTPPTSTWSWAPVALHTDDAFTTMPTSFDVATPADGSVLGLLWFSDYDSGMNKAQARFALAIPGVQNANISQVAMSDAVSAMTQTVISSPTMEYDSESSRYRMVSTRSTPELDQSYLAEAASTTSGILQAAVLSVPSGGWELPNGQAAAMNRNSSRWLFVGGAKLSGSDCSNECLLSLGAWVRSSEGKRIDGNAGAEPSLILLNGDSRTVSDLHVASTSWGEDFAVFYRDTSSTAPIKLQRIAKNDSLSGEAIELTGVDLLPRAAVELGDYGLILIGVSPGAAPHLYAQRLSAKGKILGEPVLISSEANTALINPSRIRARGRGKQAGLVFSQQGDRYRLMKINSCKN